MQSNQPEPNQNINDQPKVAKALNKPDTFGERIENAAEDVPSIARDPDDHYELTYRDHDELGEWLLRNRDQEIQ